MKSGSGHVLVVDDNRMNRLKLSRSLEQQGHTVATAENGQHALELLRTQPFDLVLLDIMMPEMDGYQVLEKMKADGGLRDIPIVVISALDELDSVVKCIEMGAEDYLPKSFEPTLLRARIGASLEKKRLRETIIGQLGKYVPESVAETIVTGAGTLEPMRREATILYSDIESFTTVAESMAPERVVEMLNDYFTRLIEPIMRNNGVVNQFQGDAMLVTFNVPLEDPHHADHALQAAVEIQNTSRDAAFAGVPLRTRIGINTGEIIAGNVGAGNRYNYTVHGDAVNLAARLEQLNKQHGTLVLVSGTTVERLTQSHSLERIGALEIRGKIEPVDVYNYVFRDEGDALSQK